VFCSLFDVDVSSTNFIVDVFDEFNVDLNDDVIYRISEESASFKVFKNSANDVIIINNKIHLIIMNDVSVICKLTVE
jgi:NADPH-dependent 7-cyano-7-deazaguanine reductase QueF-like protein